MARRNRWGSLGMAQKRCRPSKTDLEEVGECEKDLGSQERVVPCLWR